jgi:hypothetical protein
VNEDREAYVRMGDVEVEAKGVRRGSDRGNVRSIDIVIDCVGGDDICI